MCSKAANSWQSSAAIGWPRLSLLLLIVALTACSLGCRAGGANAASFSSEVALRKQQQQQQQPSPALLLEESRLWWVSSIQFLSMNPPLQFCIDYLCEACGIASNATHFLPHTCGLPNPGTSEKATHLRPTTCPTLPAADACTTFDALTCFGLPVCKPHAPSEVCFIWFCLCVCAGCMPRGSAGTQRSPPPSVGNSCSRPETAARRHLCAAAT